MRRACRCRDGVDGQLGIEDLPPVQRIAVHGDGHGDGQFVRDDAHAVVADGALAAHGLDRHV